MTELKYVGQPASRIDGLDKVTGAAQYVDDLDFGPQLLHAEIVESPYAHALIKSIDTSAAEKVPGVVRVVTGKEFAHRFGLYMQDRYIFPTDRVRFVGEQVAAVIARDEKTAKRAAKLVKVAYKELTPVLDLAEALKENPILVHPDLGNYTRCPWFFPQGGTNIAHWRKTRKGDVEKGFAEADVILEDTYTVPRYAHCAIETHSIVGLYDLSERLTLWSASQSPYTQRHVFAGALAPLGLRHQDIRVVTPYVGGGFGGKAGVSMEILGAALAMMVKGRPVKVRWSRAQEFYNTYQRQGVIARIKLGVKKDGTITAIGLDCVSNTGAYGSHALTVVCNCGSKILPLYRSPNVHFVGTAVYTNLPVGGAYRGYGATQSSFGIDCAMDELAEAIGMDPLEFRMRNHIRSGETSPVFAALGEGKAGVEQAIGSCELDRCIKAGAKAVGWKKRKDWRQKTGRFRRGIGMACLMQGSSIPEIDMGAATIKINEDGSFNLLIGATDLGTGSDTVMAQIAAETLGTDVEKIIVYSSDTDVTPFDVGAYASSTTYLSGQAVLDAATKVRKQILGVAAEMLSKKPAELNIADAKVIAKDGSGQVTFSEVALHALYASNQFQIGAISSAISHKSPPPFSAHFAEVEVDTETGKVVVIKYVAAVDCGTAINPKLAEGQTEGGVMNGISYALTEEYLFDRKGKMTNDSFLHYRIFSMRDKPELVTILVPSYEKTGPYGAKSVSEICINGPCPAISNAIYNAVGVRLREIPFTPEKVWRAMKNG